MDDHTNDSDPDRPPVGTPEELEEALKWLEDLTARQGKPADVSKPAPAASLDSPFRGLIDSEDGDLPDWLRELPASQLDDSEPESRLDWLAKMAQQESIEELPTLEWRRLSEPAQSAILSGQSIDLPTQAYPGPGQQDEPEPALAPEITAETIEEILDEPDTLPPTAMPEESLVEHTGGDRDEADGVLDETPAAEAEPQVEAGIALEEDPRDIAPTELDAETTMLEDELIVSAIAPVTMGLDEILVEDRLAEDVAERLPDEPADMDGPLDDLDAAMAWIEELAASQDAPIEDVPSVADRALASKLMMEAGLTPTVSPLDELGSDSDLIEGMTPTHPFIEEEDFADTVVLVETLAADQGIPLEPPTEPLEAPELERGKEELGVGETSDVSPIPDEIEQPFGVEMAADELSFEEAMAFLDEMAGGQSPLEEERLEFETVAVDEQPAVEVPIEESMQQTTVELDDEPRPDLIADEEATNAEFPEPDLQELEVLSAKDAPWLDTPAEETIVHPVEYAENLDGDQIVVEGVNGSGFGELEAALLTLDALALPPGRTLDEVNAKFTAAQMTSWRDLDSALDWLEETLSREAPPATMPNTELDDASLIEQMPEDPDAVLAWLEQMAANEEAEAAESSLSHEEASGIIIDRSQPEPLVEELAEADLLNMPDDPDEAMAWLEGLARGGHPAPAPAISQDESFVVPELIIAEDSIASPIDGAGFESDELPVVVSESVETTENLLEDEIDGEPEVEIFVDQDHEVVIIDTELEDAADSMLKEASEDSLASTGEQIAGGEFPEALPIDGEAILERVSDDLASGDIFVEDMMSEGEIGLAELEGPQAEEVVAEDVAVAEIDEPIPPGEISAELPKIIVAEEIAERVDEETEPDEHPAGEVIPEVKTQLPSWLDLLKPLD